MISIPADPRLAYKFRAALSPCKDRSCAGARRSGRWGRASQKSTGGVRSDMSLWFGECNYVPLRGMIRVDILIPKNRHHGPYLGAAGPSAAWPLRAAAREEQESWRQATGPLRLRMFKREARFGRIMEVPYSTLDLSSSFATSSGNLRRRVANRKAAAVYPYRSQTVQLRMLTTKKLATSFCR